MNRGFGNSRASVKQALIVRCVDHVIGEVDEQLREASLRSRIIAEDR